MIGQAIASVAAIFGLFILCVLQAGPILVELGLLEAVWLSTMFAIYGILDFDVFWP